MMTNVCCDFCSDKAVVRMWVVTHSSDKPLVEVFACNTQACQSKAHTLIKEQVGYETPYQAVYALEFDRDTVGQGRLQWLLASVRKEHERVEREFQTFVSYRIRPDRPNYDYRDLRCLMEIQGKLREAATLLDSYSRAHGK
jgi:hypothetical protein